MEVDAFSFFWTKNIYARIESFWGNEKCYYQKKDVAANLSRFFIFVSIPSECHFWGAYPLVRSYFEVRTHVPAQNVKGSNNFHPSFCQSFDIHAITFNPKRVVQRLLEVKNRPKEQTYGHGGGGRERMRCMEGVTWKLNNTMCKIEANGNFLYDSGNSNRSCVST